MAEKGIDRKVRLMDLILSSGFLAFATHCGFLDAIDDRQIAVDALCGTSSGALVGALWISGLRGDALARELSSQAPIRNLAFSKTPWRGLFSMKPLLEKLDRLLPATFDRLPLPFAVGVTKSDGQHRLISSGPLPLAVAASCALPYIMNPIHVDGTACRDGALSNRIGIAAWRGFRGNKETLLHFIPRPGGICRNDHELNREWPNLRICHSPAARANFFSLKDFEQQRKQVRRETLKFIAAL